MRTHRLRATLATWTVLALATAIASADPAGPHVLSSSSSETEAEPRAEQPADVRSPVREHTGREVSGAPVPGDESGRLDGDPGDSTARIVARGLLFLPKLALELVMSPIRGGIWVNDRYELVHRYTELFWNDERTIGLYPTVSYSLGYTVTAGVRFDHKDLIGEGEELVLQAAAAPIAYRQSHAVKFRTGNRLGKQLELEIDGNFDRFPTNSFYGIGNADLLMPPHVAPVTPIHALTDSTAVASTYRYQELRAAAQLDVRVVDGLQLVLHGAVTDIETSPAPTTGSTVSIEQAYAAEDLVGFMHAVTHVYNEIELRWDNRRVHSQFEPRGFYSEGALVSAFVGPSIPLRGDGAPFWHYGAEAQHFVRLAAGPRALAFRLRAEGVTGPVDGIPFVELPYLGGDAFLRGYSYQRFRDRVAAVGTVQYGWDLSRMATAHLFVDAGRVYPSLADLSIDHMRVGFGLGIEIRNLATDFLMEGTIGSSIDGGLVLTLGFNRVLDARPRWR